MPLYLDCLRDSLAAPLRRFQRPLLLPVLVVGIALSCAGPSNAPGPTEVEGSDLPASTDVAEADLPATTDALGPDTPLPTDVEGPDLPASTDVAEADLPATTDVAEADLPAPTDVEEADLPAPTDVVEADPTAPSDVEGSDTPAPSDVEGSDTPAPSDAEESDTPAPSDAEESAPCPLLDCDDVNGCTIDWCDPAVGCMHVWANGPCNDGDPCTNSDWCIGGLCVGQPSPCGNGMICEQGKCVCEVTCQGKQCGFDSCGSSCGVCGFWQDCADDLCVDHYPPPPYGPNQGQVVPDHELLLPEDLASVFMRQYWKEGKLLLMTYNAGWCKVCKEDTVLLNLWHAAYGPAGLRIASVMYENPSGGPITQDYALFWQSYYSTQYTLLMDQPTADWQGKATGGALNFYYPPSGPIPDGTFPATMLICPRDMRVLYIKAGFYDEEVTPLVMKYLFEVDC